MDPLHILQFSAMTRIMNESSNYLNHPYIIAIVILYGIYKLIPYHLHEYLENEFKVWFFDLNNESSIIIPYHIKTYSGVFSTKSIEKTLYSERFRAINHYVIKTHLHKLFSLIEVINSNNSICFDSESSYILLPKCNQKIKICEKENIFFEIFLEKKQDSDENKKDNNETHASTKKYMYKISKNGKESIQCINSFLEKLVQDYTNEILNKSTQMVFEYQKIMKDDDERILTVFKEIPFKTNKSFNNIFFEGKTEFIEYISQFSLKTDANEKKLIQNRYQHAGIPYKSVILLHGDPGCGKSSLIKSTIEYTGRHCILVSWSRIRSANDFISLFRPLKIGEKTYYSNELILVFEDFDANNSEIIKKRNFVKKEDLRRNSENDETDSDTSTSPPTSSINLEDALKTRILDELKLSGLRKSDDDITLEFILNVLDGIIELYDIIIFFTTNDIDIIDPALKRSGRIDRIIKMEKATPLIIKEMLSYHYNLCESEMKSYQNAIDYITPHKHSYSDISQICNHSKTIEDCLYEISKVD